MNKKIKKIIIEPLLLLALPLSLIPLLLICLLRPLFKIKIGLLHSDRIGHFAMNTELSILEDIKNKNNSFLDLYYFGGKICNTFLAKKWTEKLYVLPIEITCT